MKGDFSRDTFDPTDHYAGVLKQQGKVDLDADWNEEHAIRQYIEETTTADVVGPCGGDHEPGCPRSGAWRSLVSISEGLVALSGHRIERLRLAPVTTGPDNQAGR